MCYIILIRIINVIQINITPTVIYFRYDKLESFLRLTKKLILVHLYVYGIDERKNTFILLYSTLLFVFTTY